MGRKKRGFVRNVAAQFAIVGVTCYLSGIATEAVFVKYHPTHESPSSAEVSPLPSFAASTPAASLDPHGEWTFDNILVRLNEARLAAGLKQVSTDSYLSGYAQKDLAGNCPVTGHSSFRDYADQKKFSSYKGVAEVLTSGAGNGTPQQAIEGFLGSPTHKDIVLDGSYTRAGIGVSAENGYECVSVIFGK